MYKHKMKAMIKKCWSLWQELFFFFKGVCHCKPKKAVVLRSLLRRGFPTGPTKDIFSSRNSIISESSQKVGSVKHSHLCLQHNQAIIAQGLQGNCIYESQVVITTSLSTPTSKPVPPIAREDKRAGSWDLASVCLSYLLY